MAIATQTEKFLDKQIAVVERTAKQLYLRFVWSPTFNPERAFTELRRDNPFLRGVSFREISIEMLSPGSFAANYRY